MLSEGLFDAMEGITYEEWKGLRSAVDHRFEDINRKRLDEAEDIIKATQGPATLDMAGPELETATLRSMENIAKFRARLRG